MENNTQNQSGFSYNYSSSQQEEIKKIRKKYLSEDKETGDKISRLRSLDRKATDKATVASLVIGIISALVLGVGMCFCLVWNTSLVNMIVGIIVGIIGIIGVLLAYPIYNLVLSRARKTIAPEIIRLSDELLK